MTVGIMGLGYVGLPLAVAFAEAGEHVLGVDVDAAKVAALRRDDSYIEDIPSEQLAGVTPPLEATTRAAAPRRCATRSSSCVPTPLTPNREPDLGPLLAARAQLGSDVLQPGQLVVLESTTYPGTTRERLLPILEESGLAGRPRLPPRLLARARRPGQRRRTRCAHTPKIVGGLTPELPRPRRGPLRRASASRSSRSRTPEVAEMAKLLENIFRSVNIALVNELAMLAERMGIDIYEVIDAAATKPFGFMRFDPGPGMGGHCLPVDPFYLSWKARELRLLHRVHRARRQGQPAHAVRLAVEQGRARAQRAAARPSAARKIAILGVAYKPGVGDVRESPVAEDHRAPARRSAPRWPTTTRYVPELPQFGLANRVARRRRWTAPTWRSSSPPTRASTTTRSPTRCRSSTCAGSPAPTRAGGAAARTAGAPRATLDRAHARRLA